jgi:hypothetical protein
METFVKGFKYFMKYTSTPKSMEEVVVEVMQT